MSQLAPGPAPYVSEVGRLNGPLHGSAAKPAQLLLQMCLSATLTSRLQGKMSGALKSLLMDFLCGVARSSQLTPPRCPHSCLLGHPAAAVGPLPAQPLQMPAEARNAPTLSSGGRRGAAWSFSASRLADAGVLKLPASSGRWLEHEHALPSLCSVQQPSLPSLGDGRGCCRLLQQGPSLPACSPCQSPIPPMLMASLLCSATSSLTPPSHLLLPPAWRSVCVCERRAAGALVALGPRGWSQKGVGNKKSLGHPAFHATPGVVPAFVSNSDPPKQPLTAASAFALNRVRISARRLKPMCAYRTIWSASRRRRKKFMGAAAEKAANRWSRNVAEEKVPGTRCTKLPPVLPFTGLPFRSVGRPLPCAQKKARPSIGRKDATRPDRFLLGLRSCDSFDRCWGRCFGDGR